MCVHVLSLQYRAFFALESSLDYSQEHVAGRFFGFFLSFGSEGYIG